MIEPIKDNLPVRDGVSGDKSAHMEEKMIEKQTMKLKLDSLIIQKGRLAPKHTGFQKDEL
jgi:hypothetical protein